MRIPKDQAIKALYVTYTQHRGKNSSHLGNEDDYVMASISNKQTAEPLQIKGLNLNQLRSNSKMGNRLEKRIPVITVA
jgi:hypothetical protein